MCWLQQSAQLWYYPRFTLILFLVLGFIECAAGLYAWRFLLGANGAVAGVIAGALACIFLNVPILILPGMFIGAIAGATLFAAIVPLGSFLFALLSVMSFLLIFGQFTGWSDSGAWLIAAGIAGFLCASAAAAGHQIARILITAICGAQQLVSGSLSYFAPPELPPDLEVLGAHELLAITALALIGLGLQLAILTLSQRPAIRPAAPAHAALRVIPLRLAQVVQGLMPRRVYSPFFRLFRRKSPHAKAPQPAK